ncbi:hypothetical protein L218DRAFT_965960 [Marasmius fiardii PR-910]|nr:hypothetical protein L218DRAFT_965960 [Marasmius fiardii PR-910]
MSMSTGFLFYIFFWYLLSLGAAQGIGTSKCNDTGLDWYTGKVGETPCRTYERLRQICNSNFRVGQMNPNTPPDFCNEQVAGCCCNNIAFSLAMLCLTCQQGVGTAGNGIDAGVGAYQLYLTGDRTNGFCQPQTNKSLPADVQSAVCNQNINIYDDLYNIMWDDGQWFYTFTSQTITKDQNANPAKVFTKCTQTSSSSSGSQTSSGSSTGSGTSPSNTGSGSSNATSSKGGLSTGAKAGIAVGIVVAAIAAALALLFWWRRKKRIENERYVSASGLNIDGSNDGLPPQPPYSYTPVSVQAITSQRDTRLSTTTTPGGSSSHPYPAASAATASNHSHERFSPTPALSNGRISGSDYFSTSAPPGYVPQRISGSHSGYSGSGGGSGGPFAGEARTGFMISNPDFETNTGSGASISERLTSPRSPSASISGTEATSQSRSSKGSSQPHPTSLPGKAGLNMRNTRYLPPTVDPGEVSERHEDAGPVPGASLNRNLSGRLPPAYGDLIRESED